MTNVFIFLKDVDVEASRWIDARFSLQDIHAGKNKYEKAHVKNAVHWDLHDDLSNLKAGGGRHPLPTKAELVDLFEKSGLTLDAPIVIYDEGGSPFATRVWWILQYAGFTNASVLLEGFEAIQAAGIPVDDKPAKVERTSITPNWNEAIFASRQYVVDTVSGEKEHNTLVDARAAGRYRGEHEPLDRIAGHIPGALNFDWEQLKKDGRYRFDAEVESELKKLMNGREEVTVYCGSGVTATPIYAMLTHFGYENVRLYAGSYSDWVSEEDAPIETEENRY